jgi:hypothetical protein
MRIFMGYFAYLSNILNMDFQYPIFPNIFIISTLKHYMGHYIIQLV